MCFSCYLGSGIYSGHHGALNAIMSDVPVIKYLSKFLPTENFIYFFFSFFDKVTKLIVAQVPKTPDTPNNNLTTFKTAKQWNFLSSNPSTILEKENIPDIQLALLNFTQSRFQKGQLCHNDFCCQYDIEVFVHRLPPNSVSFFHSIFSLVLFCLQKQPATEIIFKSTIYYSLFTRMQ